MLIYLIERKGGIVRLHHCVRHLNVGGGSRFFCIEYPNQVFIMQYHAISWNIQTRCSSIHQAVHTYFLINLGWWRHRVGSGDPVRVFLCYLITKIFLCYLITKVFLCYLITKIFLCYLITKMWASCWLRENQCLPQMHKIKNPIMLPLIWEEFPGLTQCHLQGSEQVEIPESQSNMLRKKTHFNRKSEILC